jgi:nuclear protein localization family protein 4
MGWLYGYYSEDPNFPDGVRVNIEAIYEPPQIGELKSVIPLDDPYRATVDMVASALSLERVGFIFTSLNQEKCYLTGDQIRTMAAL